MAKYITNTEELTSIANAIRTKSGTNASLSYPTGFVSAIEAISTGNTSSVSEDVIFIDYDGTIITTKSAAEINAMTSDSDLPENPTHTGLIAQGWNWTVAQLKAQLLAIPNISIFVGQMYTTASGATEIDVTLSEGLLSPILTIAVEGSVTVDWGDNSTPDILTGSSLSSRLDLDPHNYTNTGNYTITIKETEGSEYAFYTGSSSYSILRKGNSESINRGYASCINNIRFGNGIKKLEVYMCNSLIELQTVTIPKTITEAAGFIFYRCYNIKHITIPNSLQGLTGSMFCECYSLVSISIPGTITTMENNVFDGCLSLKKITIPSTVTPNISNSIFNKTGISNIVIPSGITSLGTGAIANCNNLKSISIPNTVTTLGSSCFYNCLALSDVTLSDNITSIPTYCFYYCYSLTNLTIPSKVTSIGNYAFLSCSLKYLTIPEGVTTIGTSAFQYCYRLIKLTIPSTITSINNYAFGDCLCMQECHILATTPPTLGTSVFNFIPSDCIIYVPYSADHSILTAYQTASGWSTYASYMQEEPNN